MLCENIFIKIYDNKSHLHLKILPKKTDEACFLFIDFYIFIISINWPVDFSILFKSIRQYATQINWDWDCHTLIINAKINVMARNGKDQRYFSCKDNLLKDRDLTYTNTKLRRDVQKNDGFCWVLYLRKWNQQQILTLCCL